MSRLPTLLLADHTFGGSYNSLLRFGSLRGAEETATQTEIRTISLSGLSWVLGDAEELPFDDDKFDFYTIGFGIRNVTHMDRVQMAAFSACVILRILLPLE